MNTIRRRTVLLVALCVVSVFSSCETTTWRTARNLIDSDQSQRLPGMVYDGRNQAVSGVDISVDDRLVAQTDINGRFFIRVSPGTYRVDARREGYEAVSTTFDFTPSGQALHIRMTAISELLDMATEQIERQRWEVARSFLGRAYAVDGESPEAMYLEAVLLYRTDEPHQAIERLRVLLDYGYDDAYVLLFLADLYQYALDEPERALDYLRRVERLIGNEEVRARIIQIEADMEEMP
ncbi:MAG: carboxypeptidase regulatory-like domain-containing protein [Spirochaetales bacterium]|nr:carboxypeptidase regulatory-like domain-containing protein [Spirochaetales bacterium]